MPLRRKAPLPVIHRFIPYNGKIADISEADTEKHFLDLETALGETRKIVMVGIICDRISGTGVMKCFPNEGTYFTYQYKMTDLRYIVIKEGTQRLQYAQTVANDDFDVYCLGYVVEA